jgi:hypothetical protein
MRTLQEWSKAVKERDGRCMECGSLEHLHAHHVLPKSTNPELRLEVSNGRTLCYGCHKRWHEQNRPPRLRTNRPQRKTLNRRIEYLEAEVKRLESEVRKLSLEVKTCERGRCRSAMRRYAQLRQYGLTPSELL